LELARKDDFIGVQTYTRQRVGNGHSNLPPPKDAELTQNGFEFYPEALEHAIRYASQHIGVPLIATENGVAVDDDARRIEYIKRAVQGVKQCLADKIDVRGYIYW
jgi:beta-glucosidase